jgi:hypothetical protein
MLALIIVLLLLLLFIKYEFYKYIKLIAIILVGSCGVLLMHRKSKQVGIFGGGKRAIYAHIEPRLKLNVKYCTEKKCTDNIFISDDIRHLIDINQPPNLSHVPINATEADNFDRCITNDSPVEKYVTRRAEFKRSLHWGQLKLMLTEIEFLTLVMNEYAEAKDSRDIYFVYAGAAPGHHTAYLSELFPNIHFELYDPNKFVITNTKMIKIHVGFFTDDIARYWSNQKDKYVVFCSDIRTEPANDENVRANMIMQLDWWKIINPELSMFKFRLPWYEGFTEYPEGKIYIQPYPGPTSTETRLIVKANAKLIKYDNVKYEGQLFYHNTVSRYKLYKCSLGKLDLKHDHLDNCYDCVSFVNIAEDYLKIMKKKITKETIYKLVQEIQNKITYSNNVYSQTVRNFNDYMKVFSNYTFKKEDGKIVSMCLHGDAAKKLDRIGEFTGLSKATLSTYKTVNSKKGGQPHHHESKHEPKHSCEDDKCFEGHHIHFVPDGDKYDADTVKASIGELDELDIDEIIY